MTATDRMSGRLGNGSPIASGEPVDEGRQRLAGVVRAGAGFGMELEGGDVAVAPTEAREATHVSLYDGTVEGFDFPELRARSVQFHPEAGPGPHDAWPILERWLDGLATAVNA